MPGIAGGRKGAGPLNLQSIGALRGTGDAWTEAHLGESGEQSSGSPGRKTVERTSVFVERISLRGAVREPEV
jgi:hypothetical protein